MKISTPAETGLFTIATALAVANVIFGLPMPSEKAQTIALAIGVGLVGLPHGALDPLIAWRAGLLGSWRATASFHVAYVVAAVLMVGLWLWVPILALVLFLAYSAYHFAGDWFEKSSLARFAIGAALLGIPAFIHGTEVSAIYAMLSGEPARQIAGIQHALAPVWLGTLAAAAWTYMRLGNKRYAIEIIAIIVSAMLLPPLVFFIIYFCFLHSPRHFLAVWNASPNKQQAALVAVSYTALTLAVAIPSAYFLGGSNFIAIVMQQVVFIGLAALTVPHMILSSIMDKRSHV